MAAIVHLPSGGWQARVRRKGFPTRSKVFARRFDAEGWARKVEGDMERGLWRDSSASERMTLREALDRYEREVTPRKRAQSTEKSNLRILRDEKIANLALARIGSIEVANLRDAWLSAGLAPGSIKRRMVTLSHVFTVASTDWGMTSLVNPKHAVSLPTVHDERRRRASNAEIRAICAATGSAELEAFVWLAVETTMRRGELSAIRWVWISLESRVVRLPKAITKTEQERQVPLSTRAIEVLRRIPRTSDGRVFSMAPDSYTQAFERAVSRARAEYENECQLKGTSTDPAYLINLRLHDLRHEGTSRLFEDHDLDVMEAASVTGHSDLRSLKRYTHLKAENIAQKMK